MNPCAVFPSQLNQQAGSLTEQLETTRAECDRCRHDLVALGALRDGLDRDVVKLAGDLSQVRLWTCGGHACDKTHGTTTSFWLSFWLVRLYQVFQNKCVWFESQNLQGSVQFCVQKQNWEPDFRSGQGGQ